MSPLWALSHVLKLPRPRVIVIYVIADVERMAETCGRLHLGGVLSATGTGEERGGQLEPDITSPFSEQLRGPRRAAPRAGAASEP